MRRRRARGALIAGVTFALGALGFVLGRTMVARQQAASSPPPGDIPNEVSQRISDFRRVKVKDGRKVWELVAREADVKGDRTVVEVASPAVSFFAEDGRAVEVKGAKGLVHLDGSNVQKIELGGGIEVRVGDYLVRTDEAVYVQAEDSVTSPGKVRVEGAEIALEGDGLVIELARQRLRFLRGVTTTMQPGRDAAGLGLEVRPSAAKAAAAPAEKQIAPAL